MPVSLAKVRAQLHHYLSPEVASVAGLSLEQLRQIIGGTFHPTTEQIEQLARRMHMQ